MASTAMVQRSKPRGGRRSVLLVVGAATLLGILVFVARLVTDREAGADHDIPASIADDCSRPVDAELNRFIATVPNGSTIRFAAGGCYAQAQRIQATDKVGVTFDGNGATFRSSAPNDGRTLNPNWLLLRARSATLKNMTLVGGFNLTGPRSQERVNQEEARAIAAVGGAIPEAGYTGNQFNPGIGVYGGDTVHIVDVNIEKVFGDGVVTAPSDYVDAGAARETPRNVQVQRVNVTTTARHCISPNQAIGFRLEDSVLRDCWYGGIDAELDDVSQELKDIHVLRNTFDGYFMFGVAIPVAGNGDNTSDIEIRDNRFLAPPDNFCNQVVVVGIYPTNPNTFKNVVVENNAIHTSGTAIEFEHVIGGSIQNNTITQVPPGTTAEQYCNGSTAPVLKNSSGVTVANNRP